MGSSLGNEFPQNSVSLVSRFLQKEEVIGAGTYMRIQGNGSLLAEIDGVARDLAATQSLIDGRSTRLLWRSRGTYIETPNLAGKRTKLR